MAKQLEDRDDLSFEEEVAVIGMAGRFPGARNIDELWERLRAGQECISFFSERELEEAGVDAKTLKDPNYVKAASMLEGFDRFDAEFFSMTPREAEITDPQQRVFLEVAWEAFENAGYEPSSFKRPVGVFASASLSRYLMRLYSNPEIVRSIGNFRILLGNDRDFLPTWVSYKFDLKGPSINVQTACSSSLVAVHTACQSLLNCECDMAAAGGVSVRSLSKGGYFYQEGGVNSPDGHCRAFDAEAKGTVSGDGVGVVILKRLSDALQDGDTIHAVIKGSAVNNDGANKIGFTAPAVEGQARVISEALAMADIGPEEVQYIEAHGTGTPLGDPIEVKALCQAFQTQRKGFCALGSIKSNMGHLDAAAGVAGLIKAVEALKRREVPASLHYESPNPRIDFENSPFFVNSKLTGWESAAPRRAGVSSFGMGGTNAHLILEEAPGLPPGADRQGWNLLLLSARTPSALETLTSNLARHLKSCPQIDIADACLTLLEGRRRFRQRRMLVCRCAADAAKALQGEEPERVLTTCADFDQRSVAFLFPGQGSQYPCMGLGLYQEQAAYRRHLDECLEILQGEGLDLAPLLHPPPAEKEDASRKLAQTVYAQPAIFTVEYCLARLWESWGVKPQAMIGHSLGEYVAACLAGVFSLPDALRLVAARGRLMDQLQPGGMLSVALSEQEIGGFVQPGLSLAAINAPSLCTLSGPSEAIRRVEQELRAKGIESRRLHTSHAFHSEMMEPALKPFRERFRHVRLNPPSIPFISNLSGSWIQQEEATDPEYWVRHLRQAVRFSDGIVELMRTPDLALLEVGPGTTLSSLARRQPAGESKPLALASLRHPQEDVPDSRYWLGALGRLWLAGCRIQWPDSAAGRRPRRIPLPTYPFERKRHWVGSVPRVSPGKPAAASSKLQKSELDDWFYLPSWKLETAALRYRTGRLAERMACWILFLDQAGLGKELASRLRAEGQQAVTVCPGQRYACLGEDSYSLRPGQKNDCMALLQELENRSQRPATVIHLGSVTAANAASNNGQDLRDQMLSGFLSLMALAQALVSMNWTDPIHVVAVSSGLHQVVDSDQAEPEKAPLLGFCRVVPQESPNFSCQNLDIQPPSERALEQQVVEQLMNELCFPSPGSVIALRGRMRWKQDFQKLDQDCGKAPSVLLRQGGVYLITGGTGNLGTVLAGYLARRWRARLALTCRSRFPLRKDWPQWLASHPGEDPVSWKIRRYQELEEEGAQIEVIAADVANQDAMRAAVENVEEKWGPLNGVIHAAASTRGEIFRFIQETDRANIEQHFRPKVQGLLVLEELLRGKQIDFCMLTSSLASILGGLGMAAYAAANLYMDAFVQRQALDSNFPWITVNWDGWDFSGQPGQNKPAGAGLALTPQQGEQAIERLFSMDGPRQVVISTADLHSRMHLWVDRPRPSQAAQQPLTAKQSRPGVLTPYRAPQTSLEKVVCTVCEELLGIEPVGSSDNFFELGGDSLLANQLLSRLQERLQASIPLRLIFEASTIEALARSIDSSRPERESPAPSPSPVGLVPGSEQARRQDRPAPPPLVRVSRRREMPLSYAQQRLWILDRLQPGSAAYNLPYSMGLKGTVEVPVLQAALSEVVRRHEVLRSCFPSVEGRPVQRIRDAAVLPLAVIDLCGLEQSVRVSESRRLLRQEAARPFDLMRGPVLRATLLQLGSGTAPHAFVLLLSMHHIVSDAWSAGILRLELSSLYGAFSQGRPSPLKELPIQYADYASWQREWLRGAVLEQQLNYWRGQLSGAAPLELPFDRKRPAQPTYRGALQPFALSRQLQQRLRQLSRAKDATLFMTLLAGFQAFLQRYSGGQDDISVGTPIANRNRAETEGLIGFFVNTLVMRSRFAEGLSFDGLLESVRETALQAYDHQEVPFEQLVEALQPQRSLNRTPLFQVMFTLQKNTGRGAQGLAEVEAAESRPVAVTSKFDLTMAVTEKDAGLSGGLEYSLDLFEATTIRRMLSSFVQLLEEVSLHPQRSLTRFQLLAGSQIHQVLREWNAASHSMHRPSEFRIDSRFRRQASRRPDAVAVTLRGSCLSYGELERRSRRLAARLQQRGIGPESRVGVLAERSLGMVTAILSAVRAGAAYLPLVAAFPEQRLAYMLSDSGSQAVLVAPGLEDRLSGCQVPVLGLDEKASGQPWREVLLHPENLACVFYTSGSTGRPKGVAVSGQEIVRLVCHTDYIEFEPGSCVAQTTSSSFDVSNFELWGALLNGARLALAWPDILIEPHKLARWIRQEGIDTCFLTPALFNQVAASCPDAFRSLANLLCGGEAVEAWSVRLVLASGAPRRFLNAYGPTECTTFSSWHRALEVVPDEETVPIGRRMSGRLLYVLDKGFNLAPPGVAGQLHVGGCGLARGYIGRPGRSAASFLPDPFSSKGGSRMYGTGDLVAWNRRGELEFLGRLDGQLKLRGFRIESGEVESVLRQHSQVQDAVVVARGESSLKRQLVAYLIASPGSDESQLKDCLRRQMKKRLPSYMVPSALVLLDSFPLTPHGKLDRRALPDPGEQRSSDGAALLPRDALELQLARIWEEVLDVAPVGIRDDFFERGGHSLMAFQLVSRIEQEVGRKLPLGLLFQGATVERLAEMLRKWDSSPVAPSCLIALQPEGRLSPFFCVHPAGGGVFRYLRLARLVGRERPFYGLQAPELESPNHEEILSSVEDLSALYLEKIRSIQPQGPYLLGGHSFGGLVAFEMARRLKAQFDESSRLVLIDSGAPLPNDGGAIKPQALYRSFARQMGLASQDWPAERLEQLPSSSWAFELLQLARQKQLLASGLDEARLQHLFRIFCSHAQAQQKYRPQPLDLPAWLLKAGDGVEQAQQQWSRWLTGEVEAHPVPGDHFSLLEEPHVQQVADRLRRILGPQPKPG